VAEKIIILLTTSSERMNGRMNALRLIDLMYKLKDSILSSKH
jgi:hypothetical protein